MAIARIPGRGERVFATGLKGWVQIRAAEGPPRKRVTQTKIPVRQQVWVPSHYDVVGHFVSGKVKWETTQMTLKVFLFEGGDIIRTLKSEEFARTIGVAVREGGMMELLPDQAALFAIPEPVESINEPAL